jgi:hypothetical protein
MRTKLFLSLVTAMLPLSLGCEPRPVVEQPPVVEEPAVDVDVNPAPPATDESTGVDIQVGGGQGVQVDVNEDTPQQ